MTLAAPARSESLSRWTLYPTVALTSEGSPPVERFLNAHVETDSALNIEISARDWYRQGAHQVVARDLACYYAFLAAELRPIATTLTLKQALLIVDAVNGLYLGDQFAKAHRLADEVAKLIVMGSPEIWVADGRTLLRMINRWNVGQRLAVIDAAERFWALSDETAGRYEDDLRKVGLLPSP